MTKVGLIEQSSLNRIKTTQTCIVFKFHNRNAHIQAELKAKEKRWVLVMTTELIFK